MVYIYGCSSWHLGGAGRLSGLPFNKVNMHMHFPSLAAVVTRLEHVQALCNWVRWTRVHNSIMVSRSQ